MGVSHQSSPIISLHQQKEQLLRLLLQSQQDVLDVNVALTFSLVNGKSNRSGRSVVYNTTII